VEIKLFGSLELQPAKADRLFTNTQ